MNLRNVHHDHPLGIWLAEELGNTYDALGTALQTVDYLNERMDMRENEIADQRERIHELGARVNQMRVVNDSLQILADNWRPRLNQQRAIIHRLREEKREMRQMLRYMRAENMRIRKVAEERVIQNGWTNMRFRPIPPSLERYVESQSEQDTETEISETEPEEEDHEHQD